MSAPKLGRSTPPHERHPVAWYQPGVLWTAARHVLSSLDQLRNRDGRESQPLPMKVIDRSLPEADGAFAGECWFDFIADTGDGGNACYAVASAALAACELSVIFVPSLSNADHTRRHCVSQASNKSAGNAAAPAGSVDGNPSSVGSGVSNQ